MSSQIYYQKPEKKNNNTPQKNTSVASKSIWNRLPKWAKITTGVVGGLLVIGIASGHSETSVDDSKQTVIESEVEESTFAIKDVDTNDDRGISIEESISEEDEKAIEKKRIEAEREAAKAKKAEADKKAAEERKALEEKKAEEERIVNEKNAEEEKIAAEKKAEEERLALETQKAEEEKKKAEEAATQNAVEEVVAAQEAIVVTDVQQVPVQVDSSSVANGTESPNALAVLQMGPTTGGQCWVPRYGGKKYHSKSSCSGMDDPILTTVDTAITCGFDACKKCH